MVDIIDLVVDIFVDRAILTTYLYMEPDLDTFRAAYNNARTEGRGEDLSDLERIGAKSILDRNNARQVFEALLKQAGQGTADVFQIDLDDLSLRLARLSARSLAQCLQKHYSIYGREYTERDVAVIRDRGRLILKLEPKIHARLFELRLAINHNDNEEEVESAEIKTMTIYHTTDIDSGLLIMRDGFHTRFMQGDSDKCANFSLDNSWRRKAQRQGCTLIFTWTGNVIFDSDIEVANTLPNTFYIHEWRGIIRACDMGFLRLKNVLFEKSVKLVPNYTKIGHLVSQIGHDIMVIDDVPRR